MSTAIEQNPHTGNHSIEAAANRTQHLPPPPPPPPYTHTVSTQTHSYKPLSQVIQLEDEEAQLGFFDHPRDGHSKPVARNEKTRENKWAIPSWVIVVFLLLDAYLLSCCYNKLREPCSVAQGANMIYICPKPSTLHKGDKEWSVHTTLPSPSEHCFPITITGSGASEAWARDQDVDVVYELRFKLSKTKGNEGDGVGVVVVGELMATSDSSKEVATPTVTPVLELELPDDLAEEGVVFREPERSHMHVGFGGAWRKRADV
ncbi:hypothetical protein M011DRAFT_461777 [Sporormia fimetaria CBS 119925]|uniref:Uncharacterized protein n=1 Tax=Sporormia fimetaria CBS 119925 TaxID=1340428 RepID=A0A6A6V129_9PLEO|nr:hypothetical protein M011DRAFT_461777 [Sporormia fimetaria CBS 119925]